MATAITFNGNNTKGVVTKIDVGQWVLQYHDRKFWGVSGTSRIFGQRAQRTITVELLIYDATDFDTARKLTDYIAGTLSTTRAGTNGTLTTISESNYAPFDDCSMERVGIAEGPKKDEGGTLGGGWWADVLIEFTQLS